MHFQTCRRHPEAGRFLAECSGCKRELFDMQARNEDEARDRRDARAALALIGTEPTTRILSVTRTGTALIVATEQPDAWLPYAVDTFRLPTLAETDPDQDDPRAPGEWVLIAQHGSHAPEMDRMVADALTDLAEIGIVTAAA